MYGLPSVKYPLSAIALYQVASHRSNASGLFPNTATPRTSRKPAKESANTSAGERISAAVVPSSFRRFGGFAVPVAGAEPTCGPSLAWDPEGMAATGANFEDIRLSPDIRRLPRSGCVELTGSTIRRTVKCYHTRALSHQRAFLGHSEFFRSCGLARRR